MKKFAALFLAVLTLAGCSSKKSSDTEPPVENDDKAVEEAVIAYSKDDFKRIDLALQTEQKDMGVHFEEIDVSTLDFGERLSPCKKVDNPYINKLEWTDISNYDELFEESLKTPSKGKVFNAVISGDKVYLYVNYDPYCCNVHSYSIFSYDISNKELTEVISFEDADTPFFTDQYQIVDDRFFCLNYEKNCVMEIEPETGEESVFYTGKDNIAYILPANHELMVVEYTEDVTIGRMIDISTGKENENNSDKKLDPMQFSDPDGEWWTEITPGTEKELDVVTDKFRISTGLRTFAGVFLRDNKLSILVSVGNVGYTDYKMYTYDTDKMEVYMTDVSSLGIPYKIDDNLLFVYNSDDLMKTSYYVPEIGTAFEQEEFRGNIGYAGLSYGDIPMLCVRDDESYIVKLMVLPK